MVTHPSWSGGITDESLGSHLAVLGLCAQEWHLMPLRGLDVMPRIKLGYSQYQLYVIQHHTSCSVSGDHWGSRGWLHARLALYYLSPISLLYCLSSPSCLFLRGLFQNNLVCNLWELSHETWNANRECTYDLKLQVLYWISHGTVQIEFNLALFE